MAHIPALCCQAFERLLAASSDEVGSLLNGQLTFDYLAGDREYYRLPGACRARCCAAAYACACCCCCCTALTAPPRQLLVADLAAEAPGTDAEHYSCLMQPGLDEHALRALMMQSLALEQPVQVGLALRSGAGVVPTLFVNTTGCVFGLPTRQRRAGQRQVTCP